MKISARNQITGKIVEIHEGALSSKVTILHKDERIVAIITNEALSDLALGIGQEVVFIFKAQSVLVGKNLGNVKISARNQIVGKVDEVKEGAVNCEIVITSNEGIKLVAIITKEAWQELAMQRGDEVCAMIKASSILVAVY